MNIQFGVRKNNIYYPRSKIESVFNGTTDNNNSGFDLRFFVGMGVNAIGNDNVTSSGKNGLTIKSNGNVGMGNDNPQFNLEIRRDNGTRMWHLWILLVD